MCAIMMLNTVFLLSLCVATCFATAINGNDWTFHFNNSNIGELEMGSSTKLVFYTQTNTTWEDEDLRLQVISTDEDVAYPSRHFFELPQNNSMPSSLWENSFNLTTEFLGYTKLCLHVVKFGESIKYVNTSST